MKRIAVFLIIATSLFTVSCGGEPTKGCKCWQETPRFHCECINCNCRQHYRCSKLCDCYLDGNLTDEQRIKELERIDIELKKISRPGE